MGTRSSQRHLFVGVLFFALVLILMLAGCGGSSSPAPTTPAGPSSAGAPPSGGTGGSGSGGTGGGGTGGGTGSTFSDFYLASIFSVALTPAASSPQATSTQPRGTIKVNESARDGRGVLQITGGDSNSAYQLRFCIAGAPDDLTSCQTVTDYTTDGSGAASVNFRMAPGFYSGAFFIFKNGEVRFAGGYNETISGISFSTAMYPGANAKGHGRGDVIGDNARIAISNGPPSQEFRCMMLGLSSGSSSQVPLTTDAQGNGTVTFDPRPGFPNPPPGAGTSRFYCHARCQTGQCEFTYGTAFRVE